MADSLFNGMNPALLSSLTPDQTQNLMQLQQQQALGQALLQQGMQPLDPPNATAGGIAYHQSPLNGLARLADTYVGARMSRDAMGKQAQLLSQMYGGAFGTDAQQPAGVQQALAQPPVSGDANTAGLSGLSAGMGAYAPQADARTLGQALVQANPNTPMTTVTTPGPFTLPGHTAAQSRMIAGLYPEAYQKAFGEALTPTDAQRNAAAVYGYGSPQYQAALAAEVRKAGYQEPLNARPGTIIRDPYTMQPIAFNPNVPAGGSPVFDASGNVVGINSIPGAAGVTAAMAQAEEGGKGSVIPYVGFDANGNPLPVTNRTAAATGTAAVPPASANPALPAPLRNNNPGAVSPGGRLATYPDMQTGLQAMDGVLQGYAGQPDAKTLGGVITKWVGSPANAPAYIQDVSSRLGISPNQPIDLTNPAERLAINAAIMLHENGPQAVFSGGAGASPSGAAAASPIAGNAAAAAAPAASRLYGAPPLGAKTAADNLARNNAGNYNNLTQLASGSPDRVNTLDNMMALAQGTTQYGPGWSERLDRMSNINSYLPSGMAFGGDNAANAQTFQKYASYLVQQYQRAMGGGQTDAQLATVIHGTPNPDMLNKTMIEVIPKLKAMELAMQAKGAAADDWVAQHNNSPAQYNQFESMWRRNYDPRIYQMQQMPPAQRAQFMAQQPDAAALRAKAQTALQNGWVQ